MALLSFPRWNGKIRRFCAATRHRVLDEGDWSFSPEWWDGDATGRSVFQARSSKGNGTIAVLSHPSSTPNRNQWQETEDRLQKRHLATPGENSQNLKLKILGYQWRTLHFNRDTRQSTVKVMAAYEHSDPSRIFLKQQGHCLAVPYLKSMVSAGMCAFSSCNYELGDVISGKKTMRILCIGHGGGSLPLFLAEKIQGAIIHTVEVDPVVISASVEAMGFPSSSRVKASADLRHFQESDIIQDMFWKGVHERLYLFKRDAMDFVHETADTYDMIFIDAYDGDDVFPRKLWDPYSSFLQALSRRLHPEHGVVVINLHSDFNPFSTKHQVPEILPMSKHVSQICRAYKDGLEGERRSFAFVVAAPWTCNLSLVVCRGTVMRNAEREDNIRLLLDKAILIEKAMNFTFSCSEYIKRGFSIV